MFRGVSLVGVGMTKLGKSQISATRLMQDALEIALGNARLPLSALRGLLAVPALAEPRFMQAHYVATRMNLLPSPQVFVKTLDTGGAGPISGLLEAARLLHDQSVAGCVAVVAGDAVSSLSTTDFLARADAGCQNPEDPIPSPVIPHGYSRCSLWHMQTYGVTREQLAMCAALMSYQASRHPHSLSYGKTPLTLEQILASAPVAPAVSLYECARRTDGGAAFILATDAWLDAHRPQGYRVSVLGGAEASGPLYPPPILDEDCFSCEEAANQAFQLAGVKREEVDFYGLYDCFPIALLRAIEAVGLAPQGEGQHYIEARYRELEKTGKLTGEAFPVNTHGGLLGFGAPWEVPAAYSVIEAVQQLTGRAGARQVPDCRRAVVYGNGGIFSASSVALLASNRF